MNTKYSLLLLMGYPYFIDREIELQPVNHLSKARGMRKQGVPLLPGEKGVGGESTSRKEPSGDRRRLAPQWYRVAHL